MLKWFGENRDKTFEIVLGNQTMNKKKYGHLCRPDLAVRVAENRVAEVPETRVVRVAGSTVARVASS